MKRDHKRPVSDSSAPKTQADQILPTSSSVRCREERGGGDSFMRELEQIDPSGVTSSAQVVVKAVAPVLIKTVVPPLSFSSALQNHRRAERDPVGRELNSGKFATPSESGIQTPSLVAGSRNSEGTSTPLSVVATTGTRLDTSSSFPAAGIELSATGPTASEPAEASKFLDLSCRSLLDGTDAYRHNTAPLRIPRPHSGVSRQGKANGRGFDASPLPRDPAVASKVLHLLSSNSPDQSNASAAESSVSGMLDLPMGLLLLYYAVRDTCATADLSQDADPPSSAYSLLFILERVSAMRRREHRRAMLQEASALEQRKCDELYEAALQRRAQQAAVATSRAVEVAAAELAECTFHPTVSEAAHRHAFHGRLEDFMDKCLKWREEADRRLHARYADGESAGANLAGGKTNAMNARSRHLLLRADVQDRLQGRPALWVPKDAGSAAGSHGGSERSGMPLTKTKIREYNALLHDLLMAEETGGDSTPEAAVSHHISSACSQPLSTSSATIKGFLNRVKEDITQREANSTKLQKRFCDPTRGSYEPMTGQPYFIPNAMPTVVRDGQRVSYDQLNAAEQEEFRAYLQQNGMEYVLVRYLQSKRQGVQASPAARLGQDEVPLILAMAEDATRRAKNLERVRQQATLEETFRPHITPRSVRLARHRTGGVKIYDRPPKSEPQRTHSASTLRGTRSPGMHAGSGYLSPSRKRPLSTETPASTVALLARSDLWVGSRNRRLQEVAAMEEERQFSECTFEPRCSSVHGQLTPWKTVNGTSPPAAVIEDPARALTLVDESGHRASVLSTRALDAMANSADVRVINELELLRSGIAYRDTGFIEAVCETSGVQDVRRALSNVSLRTAPRLPRRSNSSRPSLSHPSPILRRSYQPSMSPLHSHQEGAVMWATPLSRGDGTQLDGNSSSEWHTSTDAAMKHRPPPPSRRSNSIRQPLKDVLGSLPPVEDPWAALDAQTEAILKHHGF